MSHVMQVMLCVRPDSLERYMPLLLENARGARDEPGCERFEVFVDPDEPTRIMLLEIYRDRDALEAHMRTPHFARYAEQAVPLLVSRRRVRWHRV